MPIDIEQWLSPHFQLKEFLHNGSPEGLTIWVVTRLSRLAVALEEVRTKLGNKPIHINSGFRTPEHNKEVGGVPNSQHLVGDAADIVVEGMTPKEVQASLKDWRGGLGSYSTWTHVDVSVVPPKRRWEGP